MSDPIVGIDLGTSNSVVAHVGPTGAVTVLADEQNVKVHPSVVSFHPNGGVVVGAAAKQRKVIDPRNTIYSAKRLIGRGFASREVQTAKGRVPYTIKQGPNQQPIIATRGGEFAVPEISAIVLDHLKNLATAALGQTVSRAVVTVPAAFNDAQRSATATAGAIAGLDIVRVINEPTAAALAYGAMRDLREVIAVYDFGGGTFDITILKLADQVYEVLGTAGDTFLGGDDLDERLVGRMVEKFLVENRMDLRTNEVAMMRLRAVAEQTKIELSRRSRAVVRVDEIAYGPKGKPLDLHIEISRDEFVRLAADLIDRTFPVCQEALKYASLGVDKIDHVILVGGTTRIPYVRDQVAKFFGKAPRTDVNPDDAIATGAALQAAALQNAIPAQLAEETSQATLVADVELGGAAPAEYPLPPREQLEPAVRTRRTTAGYGVRVETERPVERGAHRDTFGDAPPAPDTAAIGRITRAMPAVMPVRPATVPPVKAPPATAPPAKAPPATALPAKAPPAVPHASASSEAKPRLPPPPPVNSDVGRAPTQIPGRGAPLPPVMSELGHAPTQIPTRAAAPSASPPLDLELPGGFDARTQPGGLDAATAAWLDEGAIDPATAAYLSESSLDTDLQVMLPGGRAASSASDVTASGAEVTATASTPMAATTPAWLLESALDGAEPELELAPPPPAPPKAAPKASPQSRTRVAESPSPTATMKMSPLKPPAAVPRAVTAEPSTATTRMAPPPAPEPSEAVTRVAPPPSPPQARTMIAPAVPPPAPAPVAPSPPQARTMVAPSPPQARTMIAPAASAAPVAPIPHITTAPHALLPELQLEAMIAESQVAPSGPIGAPVVIDVTPRGLGIATVAGFCEELIRRNVRVPAETRKLFTTSRDGQDSVRIVICQGESRRIDDNVVLGDLFLQGIAPRPRGETTIEVTFQLDASGILQVHARDAQTGVEQRASLDLVGAMPQQDVAASRARVQQLRR